MFKKIGLFLLFLMCGILTLGPLQWYNISMPTDIRAIYKISMPLIFLGFTIFLRRNERFNQYWQVFFGFFVGSTAFFIKWLIFQSLSFPTTIEGVAFEKVAAVLLIVVPIIVLTKFSSHDLDLIYLKKGNLKLGLLIGLATFAVFAVLAVPVAILLFHAQGLNPEIILVWIPWILAFVFASGLLEEFMYRALFLKKYEPFLGPRISNLLQALIFCTIHLSVAYTPEPFLFVALTFFLGLAWGDVMQRTDSLLGSILFHAGADIPVIIGVFSSL